MKKSLPLSALRLLALPAKVALFSVIFSPLSPQIAVAQLPTATPAATPNPDSGDTDGMLPVSLLVDRNGDGAVSALAFGDSITDGVGDNTDVGEDVPLSFPGGEAGYPLRLERLLGISVSNQGDSGERLNETGLKRYTSLMNSTRPDVVIFNEGANDSIISVATSTITKEYQSAINIAQALGSAIVVTTIIPTCCDHERINGIIDSYNDSIRDLARINEVPLADVNQVYKNTCRRSNCYLLNLPEGLHPNTEGYDVYGEVVAATLLGIDILDPTGPGLLDQALMRPPGSTVAVPNAPAPTTPVARSEVSQAEQL